MTQKIIVILCFILSFFLSGCMSFKNPSLSIEFYTLEYSFPEVENLEKFDSILKIRRFGSASVYNTNYMIYRTEPNRLASYTYHKWRTAPAGMITDRFFTDLQISRLFTGVIPYTSTIPSDFVLEGYVEEFCEWDEEGDWFARISLTITLLSQDKDTPDRIVFQKNYDKKERCTDNTPVEVAKAMSRAVKIVSEEIVLDIYNSIVTLNE